MPDFALHHGPREISDELSQKGRPDSKLAVRVAHNVVLTGQVGELSLIPAGCGWSIGNSGTAEVQRSAHMGRAGDLTGPRGQQ